MMIMTPSNWLKDSAGQTRMESKKGPTFPPPGKTLLAANLDIIGVGQRNILLEHLEEQKKIHPQIDRKTLMSYFQVKTWTSAPVSIRREMKENNIINTSIIHLITIYSKLTSTPDHQTGLTWFYSTFKTNQFISQTQLS